MFNNVALDVVIGLVFVYLLYSLLGTLIEEIIATNIGLRGIILQKAIRRMLDDDELNHKAASKALLMHVKNIKRLLKDKEISDERREHLERKLNHLKITQDFIDEEHETPSPKLSTVFYAHPLIKYLSSNAVFIKKKPSYIDPETFSKVVIDLLRGEDPQVGSSDRQPIQKSLSEGKIAWHPDVHIQPETLTYLKSIWADAQGDVNKFKTNLEQWFNEMMDRTTGWYKKYTQIILLIVGLAVAGSFNVDTIKIVKILQNSPAIREQVLAQANAFAKTHQDLDAQIAKTQAQINNDGKPAKKDSLHQVLKENKASKDLRDTLFSQATQLVGKDINKVNSVLSIGWDGGFCKNFKPISILGWLLTALAISMGAPFWFDLLNKLVQLRSSVAPKDDAKSKSDPVVSPVKRVG